MCRSRLAVCAVSAQKADIQSECIVKSKHGIEEERENIKYVRAERTQRKKTKTTSERTKKENEKEKIVFWMAGSLDVTVHRVYTKMSIIPI